MTTKELKDKIKNQRGYFAENVLGTQFEKHQRDLFLTLLNNSRVAVKSAHDLGKTFTVSTASLEALFGMGPAYIIVTAPTWNLVKNVFFSEIRKKYKGSKVPLGGKLNTADIDLGEVSGEKWKMIGFSPKTSVGGDASTFQGFHAPLVIIIFEEATGVPKALYTAAEGMLTSANVKWWCIGNPTDENSGFADLFKSSGWIKVSWPCFLSPNFIANDIKDIYDIRKESAYLRSLNEEERNHRLDSYKITAPQLLTVRWVMERYLDWGEESPLFQSKVLAEFPKGSDDSLVSLLRIEQCMNRDAEEEGYVVKVNQDRIDIGMDIARFGSDNTVIKAICGNEEIFSKTFYKLDTVQSFLELKNVFNMFTGREISCCLDATGIGSGVLDNCNNDYNIAANKLITVHEIHFGSNALQEELYVNKATEMALLLANRIKSPEGMLLQDNDILAAQISARKYKHDKNGRFWIESKDDYKKRMQGKSCDELDALMLAHYAGHLATRNHSFHLDSDLIRSSNSISSQLGDY